MKTNENRTVQDRIEYQCNFVYKSLSVFLELYTNSDLSNNRNRDFFTKELLLSNEFNDLLSWYEAQEKFIPMIRHLSNEYDNNYKALINEMENLSYYDRLISDRNCSGECCKDLHKELYNKFRVSADKLVSVYC